ncbi:NAD(P)H-binding protein [Demequina sp. TTPB684]|uniref:SDR family oxidoreductase n=1 Tax=unclassified Demequina TaxID=2620311 RepID=UPI001CF58F9B|nr:MULTISPECIES: NAD(P)H-binding protein [unclassified Demequina]MCB2411836.1 NAD(P)H-binding protein [Demequina sp. TTPB684]UPU87265.1 NAD(P)H-binding protein [Demequina sp. TMPB413]
MSHISILGGTGMAGSALAREAALRGHTVTVAARHTGDIDDARFDGATRVRLDITTGQGVADAVAGADVVIYAVNATSAPRHAMCAGLRTTLDAVRSARPHTSSGGPLVVLPSIIGCEALPGAYYKAKVEQERILREWDGRSMTLRVAQFHQFVDKLLTAARRVGISPRAPLPLQPVEAGAASRAILDAIESGSMDEIIHIAGPDSLMLTAAARMHASALGYSALPLRLPLLGMGAAKGGALTPRPGAATLTGTSFVSWLDGRERKEVER